MTRERRAYVRVYYVDLQRDYPEVWFDPTCLSTWLRMLVLEDQAWPATPEIPKAARRADLETLTRCGLVELLPDQRYQVKGYAVERGERQTSARKGSGARWDANAVQTHSKRMPKRNADAMPHTEAESEAETEGASAPSGVRATTDPADSYWSLTGRYPTDKVIKWLDDLASRFGGEAVTRSLAKAHISDNTTNTLLGRAQDELRADARKLDRAEQDAERERLKEKRAIPKVVPAWELEFRAAILKQYGGAA